MQSIIFQIKRIANFGISGIFVSIGLSYLIKPFILLNLYLDSLVKKLRLPYIQGFPFWFCILLSTGMTIIMTFRPEKRYLYVHWHILFYVVLTWVTPHKLTHLCIWKKMVKIIFENVSKHFWKKISKIIQWSPNEDLPVNQSIQNQNGTPCKICFILFFAVCL